MLEGLPKARFSFRICVHLLIFVFLIPFSFAASTNFGEDPYSTAQYYKGYIITFSEEPIADYEYSLLKDIQDRESKLERSNFLYKYTIGWLDRMSIDNEKKSLNEKLSAYEQEINKSHRRIKQQLFKLFNVDEDTNTKLIRNEFKYVLNGVSLNISAEEAEKIKGNIPGIIRIEPNLKAELNELGSLPAISAGEAHELGFTGRGVKIGIVDSGVDYTHPDLGGCTREEFLDGLCEKVAGGYDYADMDKDPMDFRGHGTHVASIAAGIEGVAPDATIYAYKFTDKDGNGYLDTALMALDDIYRKKEVDILSMSFGYSILPTSSLSSAVERIVRSGIVAVASAGNCGKYSLVSFRTCPLKGYWTIISPANAKNTIAVGATWSSEYVDYYSSMGPVIINEKAIIKPDLVAPGTDICAARAGNVSPEYVCDEAGTHIRKKGTSMAAPHVSGVAALIKQKHPDWSPEVIGQVLKNTAIALTNNYAEEGYGLINALKALESEKPPIVNLESPFYVKGDFTITAKIKSENPFDYELQKSPCVDWQATEWQTVTSVSGQQDSEISRTENTLDYNNGINIFKITVTDTRGVESVAYTYVRVENTAITSPENESVFHYGEKVEIKGNAVSRDFGYYELTATYCTIKAGLFSNIKSCDEAYTEIRKSHTPVDENLLGVLNTSTLQKPGFYLLALNTYDSSGDLVGTDRSSIFISSEIMPGWPQKYCQEPDCPPENKLDIGTVPVVADLDNDGKKEIITYYRPLLRAFRETFRKNPAGFSPQMNCGHNYFYTQK